MVILGFKIRANGQGRWDTVRGRGTVVREWSVLARVAVRVRVVLAARPILASRSISWRQLMLILGLCKLAKLSVAVHYK